MHYIAFKAAKVLNSCQTEQQLKVANRYADLAVRNIINRQRTSKFSPYFCIEILKSAEWVDIIRQAQIRATR